MKKLPPTKMNTYIPTIAPRLNRLSVSFGLIFVLTLSGIMHSAFAGKIIRPWRATTAIVEQGATFEIWYDADSGQSVSRIDLRSEHKRINGLSFSTQNGDWEYDFHSGNRYDRIYTVTVPNSVPADRYELLLQTSNGEENSEGAVKVIKQYRNEYYIIGTSCAHRFQSSSSADVDGDGNVDDDDHILQLRKVSEILTIADIMDVQMYFEAGDNVYSPDSNAPYYGSSRDQNWVTFNGISELGIQGLYDTSAAVYMTAGNHEAPDNTVNGEPADELAEYFNDKWGMHYHGEVYGNARYLNVNNGWGGGQYDPKGQMNVLRDWMDNGPGRGNFIVAIMHKNRDSSSGPYESVPFDLSLSGHSHTAAGGNPYSINYNGGTSPAMQYVADSNRSTSRFEFVLFKINNSNGSYTKPSGVTARTDAVEGSKTNHNSWTRKLELDYANNNNGSRTTNSATITNRYSFPIDEAKIRFVMSGGATYSVDNGAFIRQQFTADNGDVVVDVAVDVSSNSNKTVNITPGGDPIVNFTTPSGNTVVGEGTDLNVEVSATDSDGTVSNVRLYKDGVLVRQEGGSPWTWSVAQGDSALGNLQIGSFELRAVATDNTGKTGEATITVTVADSSTQVSFAYPADGHILWEGENVDVEVNASDIDGIDRVYLYKNGVELVRSEGQEPYNFSAGQGDTELESLTPGNYALRAVAFDDLGNQGEATINITVLDLSNQPPIYINFQPSGAAIPSGYLADTSETYGDRGAYNYGWDSSFNQTRERNNEADQRLDTINHTQVNGGDHSWEIELPNGDYVVGLTGGDPSNDNSYIEFIAEEGTANAVTLMSGDAAGVNFVSGTQTVTVSDGRLTISNGPLAVNNKICYIDIAPASSNTPPVINSTAITAANEGVSYSYTVVASDADGDGLSYNGLTVPGWLSFSASGVLSGTPQSANVGPHSVSLEVSDGQDTDVQNFTITVVAAPDPYEEWKTTNNVSDDTGDEDNDGVPNLLEFALGGNPRSASADQEPEVSESSGNFDFRFRRGEATVTYIVETSTDLSTWVEHVRITDDTYGAVGTDCNVPVPISGMNNGKLFLRLKVEN